MRCKSCPREAAIKLQPIWPLGLFAKRGGAWPAMGARDLHSRAYDQVYDNPVLYYAFNSLIVHVLMY